jgi:murein DD-endopeptidase MepM/ murein hydrolase activator NlpD
LGCRNLSGMNLAKLFSEESFHPVIHLPKELEVFDFTKGYDANRMLKAKFGVGRYHEKRVGMYTTELFTKNPEKIRDIHMGIDLAAPAGTPVYAFADGKVFCASINGAAGDYGGTVITEHQIRDQKIWVLHGHLSHTSAQALKAGQTIQKGQTIAHLGDKNENGGWNPHLHLQISVEAPVMCDMPGAVNEADIQAALLRYPDPRIILGDIY